MDINMPRMNGIDARRLIKSEFPHVGIVGLSVNESEEMIEMMSAAGISAYVTKDSAVKTLCGAIEQAFSQRRSWRRGALPSSVPRARAICGMLPPQLRPDPSRAPFISPHSRLQYDFDAAILFPAEFREGRRRFIEPHAMGDDDARIDLAALYPLQQGAHVSLHVRLAGFNGERTIHDGTDGELIDESSIHHTPTIDTVPPFRQLMMASRKA